MSVTEQDEKRAVALLRAAAADGLIEATEPRHQPEMVARIAQALAGERERARAPFLALAESWEQAAQRMTVLDARKMHAAAKDIRTAAEESQ